MPIIPVAALLGLVGVALGAFGAHGLKGQFTPQAEAWWDTATFYLLTHAVAALAIGLSGRTGEILAGGWAMIGGAIVFAATLYLMAIGAPRWFGAITPIGGLALLAGWGLVIVGSLRAA
ncbi:MAG: DUF423 domain-containing protein [Pseudomonadota bacterium]|nr:DUF423 domain-containing protein [Pseudomonadota bacterium]